MTTTTDYGTWANIESVLTVEDSVRDVLGPDAGDFDVEAIAADWRAAINAALPEGVSLNGDNFYGAYPCPDGFREQLKAAVESVDLFAIIERHDTAIARG